MSDHHPHQCPCGQRWWCQPRGIPTQYDPPGPCSTECPECARRKLEEFAKGFDWSHLPSLQRPGFKEIGRLLRSELECAFCHALNSVDFAQTQQGCCRYCGVDLNIAMEKRMMRSPSWRY